MFQDEMSVGMPRHPCQNGVRGMTLIEIMAVIAILAMLTAAVAVSVFGQYGDAQHKTVLTDFKTLDVEAQLDLYALKKGALPSSSDGLKVLVREGVSREAARDPWGHDYRY